MKHIGIGIEAKLHYAHVEMIAKTIPLVVLVPEEKDKPLPEMPNSKFTIYQHPNLINHEYKSGKELRRERRKLERKSKK